MMTTPSPFESVGHQRQMATTVLSALPCHRDNCRVLNSEDRDISGPIHADRCSAQTLWKQWCSGRMASVTRLTLTEVSHQGRFSGACFFSDRLLQTCLLVKAFYTSLPFILKIYPSERQIPSDSYAFLVIQKAALVRDLV